MSGTDKLKCAVCGDPVAVVTQPERGYIHAWDGHAGIPELRYEHAVRLDVEPESDKPTLDQLYSRVQAASDMAVEAASKGDHRVDAEALRAEADAWQKIYEHAKNDRAVHMAHAISAYCAHVLALERALERALAAERRARQAGGAS